MAPGTREFECAACGRKWGEPYGTGRPTACPSCGSRDIRRSSEDRGRRGAGGRCRPGPGKDQRGGQDV